MKRFLFLLVALFLSVSALAACSSESDNKEKTESTNGGVEKQPDTSRDTKGSSEDNEAEDSEDSKKNKVGDTSSGDFKDQTELKIGDTGQAESTLGKYEITVNSVQMKDEINGKTPEIDHLFIIEYSVKNIGDKPIDAMETIKTLQLTVNLEGSGSGENTQHYPPSNPIAGTIEPGQSVTGEAVYQGFDAERYFIRTDPGLIAAGAVKNDTIWRFTKNEAQ